MLRNFGTVRPIFPKMKARGVEKNFHEIIARDSAPPPPPPGPSRVKWGKKWHSTIWREGVHFSTFDLFIHPLYLEQGEDTQVENFLELNVQKESAHWRQIH